MVSDQEKARLLKEFERSFHTVQLMRVWVDDETHEVNVKAHAIALKVKKRIPIKMGMVTGNFDCHDCELETLENAPHTVLGNFMCYRNYLKDLTHGPKSVGTTQLGGGTYSCTKNFLESFEGAPTDFTGYFVAVQQSGLGLQSVDHLPLEARLIDLTYQKNLPMLKLIQHKQVFIRSAVSNNLMTELTDIINKYAEGGKRMLLHCALDLKNAGFDGNAKW